MISTSDWFARDWKRLQTLVLEELVRRLDYERLLAEEGVEGADRWENVRELIAAAASW